MSVNQRGAPVSAGEVRIDGRRAVVQANGPA